MNKKLILAMSAVCVTFAIPTESQAVSMYARQTGMACTSCHFQHFPLLNDFGRAFKASGYTLIGGAQGEIKGEDLSIPQTMNVGIVSKLRYQKTNGLKAAGTHNTNDGRWDIPDEFNVMLGGRISSNIGFFLEGKTTEGSFLASFKMPFIYDVGGDMKAGVVPFSTGELGASFGFELLNTGAVKNQRMVERGEDISAVQYITGGAYNARGAAFVVTNPLFFANLTKWSPGHVGDHLSAPTATYFRAALTPKVGSWDLGVGLQSWSGSAETGATGAVTPMETKASAFDAQAQGALGAMPLGIYLSTARADGTNATGIQNFFNQTRGTLTKSATAIAAELGVLPGKATLVLAYRKGNSGTTTFNGENALTVGGTYQIAQNMQLQLTHALRSGNGYDFGSPNMTAGGTGDRHTTLVLFGSF